jgi:hypothetical protein
MRNRAASIVLAAALSLGYAVGSAVGLAGCASAPLRSEAAAAASVPDPAPAPSEKAVTWDPEVLADFQKDVPRFVRALAKDKMEEMAREKGSYLVDRELYDAAFAEYKR